MLDICTQDPVKIQGQGSGMLDMCTEIVLNKTLLKSKVKLRDWQGQGHGQNMECELQRWEWVVMDIDLGNKVSGIYWYSSCWVQMQTIKDCNVAELIDKK
jgi:hypothetical protein